MIKFHSILCQMLNLFPWYAFKKPAQDHNAERQARGINRLNQFASILFCQPAKEKNLMEIICGMVRQGSHLFHLRAKLMKRSSLSYDNIHRPLKLYRTVLYQLRSWCCSLQPRSKLPLVKWVALFYPYGYNKRSRKVLMFTSATPCKVRCLQSKK